MTMKRILIEGFILALIVSSVSFADGHDHHREGFQFPEYHYHNPSNHDHHNHDESQDDGCDHEN
jgi:hypothetical protein